MDAKCSLVQVSAHVRRIEAVEKDLKALTDASASKEDVSRARAEVKKIYDGLHLGKCNHFIMSNLNIEFPSQSFWTYDHMCGEFVSGIVCPRVLVHFLTANP